jgi:AraC-like DNA-binding protein
MNDTKSRAPSVDGFVRVGPLMAIPAIVRELGYDPDAILAETGLKPHQFADPDCVVPYVTGSKLLAQCAAATGCDHFGLLVGQRVGASGLGVTGFLLQSAPDVITALRDLVKHLDLHDQGGVGMLQIQGRVARLGYAIYQPGVEAAEQIYDLSIAIVCNLMRRLCGENWNPAEVVLPRKVPKDLAVYNRFFRAPLRFNADQCALVFSSRWLKHRIQCADELLHQHLEKEANRLHEGRETNFVVEVRALLRKAILSGQCTVNDIANQLCLHERSLNRRLHDKGTSFRREFENVRHELARQLLSETDMSITRISTTLNYADASAFNRAFKRWTGDTPAHWRTRSD